MVQLVNSTGSVTKTYKYDAFGVEYTPDANNTNYFRYCGQYFDTESGTYYLRARYYDVISNNCTTFAVGALEAAGIESPVSEHKWKIPFLVKVYAFFMGVNLNNFMGIILEVQVRI